MIELGATYSITGPDGTQAVFNDSTHPNFVGWLREITGLDSPEVRLEVAQLGGADGAYLTAPGYYGARPITLSGALAPGTAAQANQREEQLRRATDALRGDCILSWWPAGLNEMQIGCRRQEALRITPGRPRQFQLSLVAPDPRIYSVEQVTRIVTYAQNAALTLEVGNAGTASAPVQLQVVGPAVAPLIELVGTNQSLGFSTLTLGPGHTLDIDTQTKTVYLNGGNGYSSLDFSMSSWWMLPPQSAPLIRLRPFNESGGGFAPTTSLRVSYRHAWM